MSKPTADVTLTCDDLPAAALSSLRAGGDVVVVRVREVEEKHDTIDEFRSVSDDETWVDEGDQTIGIQFTGDVNGQPWCVHVLWLQW